MRGAGVFGLSVAYACLERGARVQVIDPGGVAAGASGGIVGALAPHTPENWNPKKQFQFESLIKSRNLWPEIEELSGMPTGYARNGRVQPIADGHTLELAHARAKGAGALWQGQADWIVRPCTGAPWEPQSSSGFVIEDSLSALINPRLATHALAIAVERMGGLIAREGSDQGQVVWATGVSGLEGLSAEAGRMVGVAVKGQAALLKHDAAGLPQLYAGGLHIIPHNDGTVAVGSTSEREFTHHRPDALLDDVIARARTALPVLANAQVLERWAGLRPRARSRAPMLGPHPTHKGHFIANGGFKIGFGMAPKVGDVMAALLLNGDDQIPAGFRVSDN